jgi:hypothetical protein
MATAVKQDQAEAIIKRLDALTVQMAYAQDPEKNNVKVINNLTKQVVNLIGEVKDALDAQGSTTSRQRTDVDQSTSGSQNRSKLSSSVTFSQKSSFGSDETIQSAPRRRYTDLSEIVSSEPSSLGRNEEKLASSSSGKRATEELSPSKRSDTLESSLTSSSGKKVAESPSPASATSLSSSSSSASSLSNVRPSKYVFTQLMVGTMSSGAQNNWANKLYEVYRNPSGLEDWEASQGTKMINNGIKVSTKAIFEYWDTL